MGKTEKFISEAREVHGDKYDYSLSEYVRSKSKLTIICKKHGEFNQTPTLHKKGSGCMKCHKENIKITTESFIKRSKKIHGDTYKYDKVSKIENSKSKVDIYCKNHGYFKQSVEGHLKGNGCNKCVMENRKPTISKRTSEDYIRQAVETHGDKYRYGKLIYKNTLEKVTITCPIHGDFNQNPGNHLTGYGCPKCGNASVSNLKKDNQEDFIKKAKDIYSDKYTYENVIYESSKKEVEITCKKHGRFLRNPYHFLQGGECPTCNPSNVSKAEIEIFNFVKRIVNCTQSDKKVLGGRELDIYIPSQKIAIEFNGLYWHSTKFVSKWYHLNKTLDCLEKGVDLIHIFEDEWNLKQEIVKSRLKNILGFTATRIHGRKCQIREVPTREKSKFLDQNHLQGKVGSKVNLGLYHNDELVSIMTFGGLRKNLGQESIESHWELLRFCNKLDTTVIGGASKLLTYFVKNYQPSNIVSYADRRWSNGGLYENLGFIRKHISQPNYFYFQREVRLPRFKFRKDILVTEGFDSTKTERQIMKERGYNRIYDCGAIRYELHSN